MSRKDLLALTPEALAHMFTLGDVKRAQRELAEGIGPKLEEQGDTTVVGTFPDAIVTKLPPGKALRDGPSTCKCASGNKCRHRVAVALAYKPWFEENLAGEAPPSSALIPKDWSPAGIDDTVLENRVGSKRIERARAAMRSGMLVTVEREGVPTAKLPACTVRFYSTDVTHAQCDCRDAKQGCEHVVVAVWAFREAASHTGASVVVSLGGHAKKDDSKPLEQALELASTLLRSGVTHAPPTMASQFAVVRTGLDKQGFVWPLGAIEDLERSLEAYAARSALYSSREVAALLCELEARARASKRAAELPARFVLGQDEAPVTPLDHVRLVSLGARLQADGRVRFAQVYLADPDTAMVLMLRKRWDFKDDQEPEEGPTLARRSVASKVTLGAIAAGQVVSKVVRRKANRELELGTSRTAMTSVTPQRGDWEALPSPILVKSLEEHEAWLRTRPPRPLRPRLLAENVHAIAVSKVEDVVYFPAQQQLLAKLLDLAEHPFFLRVTHRRVAPNAIDAAAHALAQKVRFVAGELSRGPFGFEMDPLSIAEDVMTVPDIASPPPKTVNVPHASHRHGEDPIAAAVDDAESALDELAHVGLDSAPAPLLQRCSAAAERLEDAGIESLGTRMHALAKAVKERSPTAARAWLDACVRTELVRESL